MSRRIKYARERLRNNEKAVKRIASSIRRQGAELESVFDFLEVISAIILAENQQISECIQALSGTNVRVALGLLRKFCVSPTTNVDKLMQDFNHQRFQQPLESFLRALMRGPMLRFNESKSAIANLFQVNRSGLSSHFTAVHILHFLDHCYRETREDTDITIDELIGAVAPVGHSAGDLRATATRLGRKGLILSRTHPEPPWPDDATVRIAGAGEFYLRTLLRNREYIRSLVDDTVIYDAGIHSALVQIHRRKELKWRDRADKKVASFLAYLVRREEAELRHVAKAELRPEWLRPVAAPIAEAILGSQFLDSARPGPKKRRARGTGRKRPTKRKAPPKSVG